MTQVHNQQAFTTKDSDHDAAAEMNCAEIRHGAWWYGNGNCEDTQLNGLYNDGPQTDTLASRNILWRPWTQGMPYILKGSEMKIRPVN